MFWTLLVVLKSHELAFSVFIESVSRDSSNQRIDSLYSCENIKKKVGSVLHQDLNFADAHAICSLISLLNGEYIFPSRYDMHFVM